MRQGSDVLVVIDDLTLHANIYREISLLAGKVPGRDAYPADVFYLHASLLEQGCQHKDGGSITILPIVETRGGEITDYISTNIISITDGQLVLSAKAFEKGQKPAIDFGLSVSRLGGAVQIPRLRKVGAEVRRELLSYLETREVFELVNMDEMNEDMRRKITRGRAITELVNQYKFSPIDPDEMVSRFSQFADEGNEDEL
jgi:F-type H+-transporting ATPase subunit alpha